MNSPFPNSELLLARANKTYIHVNGLSQPLLRSVLLLCLTDSFARKLERPKESLQWKSCSERRPQSSLKFVIN